MRDLDEPQSWSVMNLLFPLQVSRSESDTTIGYLASTRWVLPRVPVLGEEVEAIGHRVKVVRVLWNRDGNVTVGPSAVVISPHTFAPCNDGFVATLVATRPSRAAT